MAYIGKSPTGTGVRSRYYYTATGGETSLSGADDNSNTLVFSDGNYVDVSLNGIALVAGTDYNTSTANTIAGLSALSASDIVEIVVYDIFTVADTVSAKDGGTFSGAITANSGLNVGTIKEATGTNTAMTIGSNGLIQPKQVAFQVTASDTDQSISAITQTKVEWETVVLDTGGYWDATNHRYTPQVAGWYMFSTAIRAQLLNIHEYVRIYIRKNGAGDYYTQFQTNNDEIIGGTYQGPTVMHQLNGTTDYVEVFFFTDEATTIHENTDASWFNGFLVHAT